MDSLPEEIRNTSIKNAKNILSPILGLDLSTNDTGYFLINKEGRFGYRIKTKPTYTSEQKIDTIVNEILKKNMECRPSLVIIEEPIMGRSNKGSLTLAALAGVIRYQFRLDRIKYINIHPKTLKKFATLNGNANKDDMKKALTDIYGYVINNDNIVDAFWLAEIGLYYLYPQFKDILDEDRRKIIDELN